MGEFTKQPGEALRLTRSPQEVLESMRLGLPVVFPYNWSTLWFAILVSLGATWMGYMVSGFGWFAWALVAAVILTQITRSILSMYQVRLTQHAISIGRLYRTGRSPLKLTHDDIAFFCLVYGGLGDKSGCLVLRNGERIRMSADGNAHFDELCATLNHLYNHKFIDVVQTFAWNRKWTSRVTIIVVAAVCLTLLFGPYLLKVAAVVYLVVFCIAAIRHLVSMRHIELDTTAIHIASPIARKLVVIQLNEIAKYIAQYPQQQTEALAVRGRLILRNGDSIVLRAEAIQDFEVLNAQLVARFGAGDVHGN